MRKPLRVRKPPVKSQMSQAIEVDMFDYCFWDEIEGTVINVDGMKELLNRAQDEADMGWQFDKLELVNEDDSLFCLHFSREEG
jgi:hypothetical protein